MLCPKSHPVDSILQCSTLSLWSTIFYRIVLLYFSVWTHSMYLVQEVYIFKCNMPYSFNFFSLSKCACRSQHSKYQDCAQLSLNWSTLKQQVFNVLFFPDIFNSLWCLSWFSIFKFLMTSCVSLILHARCIVQSLEWIKLTIWISLAG